MWACYNGELDKVKRVSTPLLYVPSHIESRILHALRTSFSSILCDARLCEYPYREARVLILNSVSLPVQLLADKNKNDVNASNLNKMTALHVAVQRDHEDVIRELLRHGAGTYHPHPHPHPHIHRQVAHGKRGAHPSS
jgi:ankyrin repeat protein